MYFNYEIQDKFKWFARARYGIFIHWGPYAKIGKGEQALFRDHMDQKEYEKLACEWDPKFFDAKEWARMIKKAGFKYACLTTRHHDGYCLWDSRYTDYTSMKQAPKRDFVREYAEALREEGIRVGFYYSWCDWRIPAYYEGPEVNPEGFEKMREYIHGQVKELCTEYGKIDYFFFDGVWPRCAKDLQSPQLVKKIREWQPDIIINNRLGYSTDPEQLLKHGGGDEEGDFGTPEQLINSENRLWESCQVSYRRWWGFHAGERWKTAPEWLDSLCTCSSQGGNLIMNAGPDEEGLFPEEFTKRALLIGEWLDRNGEAIYATEGGDLTEALTFGYETIKGNNLYLIIRFWDNKPVFRLPDIKNKVLSVTFLGNGKELEFYQKKDDLYINNLGASPESTLYPVIKIECDGNPETNEWGSQRLWEGDPMRIARWAKTRSETADFNVSK